MRIHRPSRKAVISLGLFLLELTLAFVALIFAGVTFVGLYQFFVPSGYSLLVKILTVLFTSGIVIFLGLIIIRINRKLNQYLPPTTEVNQGTVKLIAYVSFGIAATISFYSLIVNYLNLFPDTIPSSLMLEIMKVIIQTNGFLIGLSGIVFAQMLWAIHNQMCGVQNSLLTCKVENEKQDLEKYFWKLDKNRLNMIFVMFFVIAFFILSILLSLSGMAQTGTNTPIPSYPNVTAPFILMTIGIITFVVLISQSKISARDKPSNNKDKQTVLMMEK